MAYIDIKIQNPGTRAVDSDSNVVFEAGSVKDLLDKMGDREDLAISPLREPVTINCPSVQYEDSKDRRKLRHIKIQLEAGENMQDISELSPCDLGEIIWQHRSLKSDLEIAKKLRVKLFQVTEYIKNTKQRIER